MYENVHQNGASLYKCQYLMTLSEEDLNESEATNGLQDGIEMLYSSIFPSGSKGNFTQSKPKCSRSNYLQSEDKVPKETNDHKNQADPELSLFSNDEKGQLNRGIKQSDITQGDSEELTQSEDKKICQYKSFQPHSQNAAQEETDTVTFCATSSSHVHKQLQKNALTIGSTDMEQPQKDTEAHLSNHDSCPHLAEKMDSKILCDEPASYTSQQLLKTTLPVDCKAPTDFEQDTKMYLSDCESQAAGRSWVASERLYEKAASYISEQLVKTALAGGSRDNITVLIVLLSGCDKIPNYLNV